MTDITYASDQYTDTIDAPFPPPPFPQTALLRPITNWPDLMHEMLMTGVDFDEHWYSCVMDEVVYFYQWYGEARATVLIVFDDKEIAYVEAREYDDQPVREIERLMIIAEIAVISALPINIDTDITRLS